MPQSLTHRTTSGALTEGMSPGIKATSSSRSQRRTELLKAPGPTPSVLYHPHACADAHQGYREYGKISPLSSPPISHSRVEPLAGRAESGRSDIEIFEDLDSGELGDTNSMLHQSYQVQQDCDLFATPSWDLGAQFSSPPAVAPAQQCGNFVGMTDCQMPASNRSDFDMTDGHLHRWGDDGDEMDYVTAGDNRSDIVDCPSETTCSIVDTEQELASLTEGDQLPDDGPLDHMAYDENTGNIPPFFNPVMRPDIDHGTNPANISGTGNLYWERSTMNAQSDASAVEHGQMSQYTGESAAMLPRIGVAFDLSNFYEEVSPLPPGVYADGVDLHESIASFQEEVSALQIQGLITTPPTHQMSTAHGTGPIFSGVGYPVQFGPMQASTADGAHCEQCGAFFRGSYARSNLGRHRRTKHGNKRYPCKVPACKKDPYTRWRYLEKHYQTHHPAWPVSDR